MTIAYTEDQIEEAKYLCESQTALAFGGNYRGYVYVGIQWIGDPGEFQFRLKAFMANSPCHPRDMIYTDTYDIMQYYALRREEGADPLEAQRLMNCCKHHVKRLKHAIDVALDNPEFYRSGRKRIEYLNGGDTVEDGVPLWSR